MNAAKTSGIISKRASIAKLIVDLRANMGSSPVNLIEENQAVVVRAKEKSSGTDTLWYGFQVDAR